MPRVLEFYRKDVVPALMKRFSYKNPMEVPRMGKIVVNMGVGEALQNAKVLEAAQKDLGTITGQRPGVTKARVSVSSFKLRKGMDVGCRVTLRGARMYEFYDRLVHVALPRVRDFRGVPTKSFDGHGNYTLGIKEHTIFPEIDYDKIMQVMGMDITLVTTAKNDEEGRELLNLLEMPFQRN
jgi:large subunit ribosomal protein L5